MGALYAWGGCGGPVGAAEGGAVLVGGAAAGEATGAAVAAGEREAANQRSHKPVCWQLTSDRKEHCLYTRQFPPGKQRSSTMNLSHSPNR